MTASGDAAMATQKLEKLLT